MGKEQENPVVQQSLESEFDLSKDSLFNEFEDEEELGGYEEEDEEPGQLEGNEDDVDSQELSRREEQSFKDKYYATQKKLEYLEERLNKVTEPSQSQPMGDPIIQELQPYIQQLDRLIQEGDITEADAKMRLQEQYMVRKSVYEINQHYTTIHGTVGAMKGNEHFNAFRGELAKTGIEAGSAAEQEAFKLLKTDWGLDPSNPSAFSNLGDTANVKKLARYISAVASTSASGSAKNQKPSPVGGGGRAPAISKGTQTKYSSVNEVSRLAREGKIKI